MDAGTMPTLRDYQSRGLELARQKFAAEQCRRMIFTSPTGSGKTLMASYLIQSHLSKAPTNRVLFLAAGIELIEQTSETLWALGVENAILMAGYQPIPEIRVQVASKDTLYSRVHRRSVISAPQATLVIVDECHESISPTWCKLLDAYDKSVIVGLTATPMRGDGKSLAGRYDALVDIAQYSELIRDGYLVPCRIFAPTEPDLSGVKVTAGEYNQRQLEDAMDKPKLVGDVLTWWTKLASDRQTVVFASGIQHSLHVVEQFTQAGIKAAHLDGNTDKDERRQILNDLESGRIQVVSNFGCLRRGWDCPPCSCLVLCQPTKRLVTYRQMAGRILRPAPGKTDALIIDHSGAVHRHGWPTDDIEWTLEANANIQERHEKKRKTIEKRERNPVTCPECSFVRESGASCPKCGAKFSRQGKGVDIADGELLEVDVKKAKKPKADKSEKQKFWDDMLGWAIGTERKLGAAAARYRQRFGVWPRGLERVPHSTQWQMPAREFYRDVVIGQQGGVA